MHSRAEMSGWVALLALVSTALGATIAPKASGQCGKIWLTVHSPVLPLASGKELYDALELNWDFIGCPHTLPRTIGLFDAKPTKWSDALVTYRIEDEHGFRVTEVSLGDVELPGGWEGSVGPKGPKCLWPWIGSGSENISMTNCLKIQPTWMEDNYDKIRNLSIGNLALAGAHNAGAWRFNTELSKAHRDRFILCQDRSVWSQLVHGIRYFDFRIAYYEFYEKEEDKYWLNHNMIRIRPLVPLLREIRKFLDHTQELVFLDAHQFPVGFYGLDDEPLENIHAGLLALIDSELGPHVASFKTFNYGAGTRGPPVGALVEANKRLIFSYVDSTISSANDWLWPTLPHFWANTNDPQKLMSFLDLEIFQAPPHISNNPMYSAMAQTTPTALDIILLRGSLRINADLVNRNVTDRFKMWWRRKANIISTDFFLGNDVIDQAIEVNVERGGAL